MNIQKTWFTAALSAGLLLPALALSGERVETFDFSRAGDGVIGGRNPAVIRTLSPYGRFRGSSALTIPGKTYPANALDRNGEWKALRFGSAKEYFTIPGFHLEPGKPFTIETWMRIYSQKPPLDGFLMDAGFGYKTGFRLVAVRSKRWAQEGWINLICGDGKTSRMLLGKNGSVNTWHHVVITTAGNAPALYIAGSPVIRPETKIILGQIMGKTVGILVAGTEIIIIIIAIGRHSAGIDLFQIVGASDGVGLASGGIQSGKQECCKNCYNCNYNQKFYQCEILTRFFIRSCAFHFDSPTLFPLLYFE